MTDKTLVASTLAQVPVLPPIPAQSDNALAWVLGATGAVLSLVFWARVRYSRDNKEISSNKAEESLIARLERERDKYMKAAEEAWATRTHDAAEISRLKTLCESHERDIQRMQGEMERMQRQLALFLNPGAPDQPRLTA